MKIDGSVALVTGAGRGLGRAFARELVSRGAAKVYGAARDPAAVTEPGVTPIALDVTDPERAAQVAGQCADVSLMCDSGAGRRLPGIWLRYRGVSTQNSWPSGSAMTTQLASPRPMRVAPRETRRSTSAC
jgi:NAD(P)-dependent dehydrogenase (short-subunit alcohol dehydrogenase family)